MYLILHPPIGTHWHDVDINGFVIEVSTWVLDRSSGKRLSVETGDKFILPASALHADGKVAHTLTDLIDCSWVGILFHLIEMRSPDYP